MGSRRRDTAFFEMIRTQAEALSALYAASTGADVVARSLTEQYVTAEYIQETLVFVALRGGMVVSCMAIFFISRQLALTISFFIRRAKTGGLQTSRGSLITFHSPQRLIWVLSGSLLFILLGRNLKIAPLEIVAWNILVICGILYLAQGGGIVTYFLTHAAMPPLMRFFLNLLLIIMIFSPGINAVLLGALILLGIAENWVPFRAPKPQGPSSTPGM
jgi:hypothetical protein